MQVTMIVKYISTVIQLYTFEAKQNAENNVCLRYEVIKQTQFCRKKAYFLLKRSPIANLHCRLNTNENLVY